MYAEAEAAFRQATRLCPGSPEVSYRFAKMYEEQGRTGEATEVIAAYLKSNPMDSMGTAEEYMKHLKNRMQNLDMGVKAEKTGYGIMKPVTNEVALPADETAFGFGRPVAMLGVVATTNGIPATVGIRFGFTFSVQGLPSASDIVLKMIVKHPPIHEPNGTTSEESSLLEHYGSSFLGTLKAFACYGFDHPYELATGDWVLEVWYGEQKLIEQTFQVFNPDDANAQTHAGAGNPHAR